MCVTLSAIIYLVVLLRIRGGDETKPHLQTIVLYAVFPNNGDGQWQSLIDDLRHADIIIVWRVDVVQVQNIVIVILLPWKAPKGNEHLWRSTHPEEVSHLALQ